eukprot:c20115_g1_i2.p1 GENE.c20115_g1_i2~~c20115_g1_i2.p1  ORF type:complete len:466 (+),score=166.05 c20115_g1_i2:94-1491(+)
MGKDSGKKVSSGSDNKKSNPEKVWSDKKGVSIGLIPGRRVFGPLFLVSVTPFFAVLLTFAVRHHQGSLVSAVSEVYNAVSSGQTREFFETRWPSPLDSRAWKFIGVFALTEYLLLKLIPNKPFLGPVTQMGHRPSYESNGVQSYFATLALFGAGAYGGAFNGGIFYDTVPEMVSALSLFSLVFCVFLYLKGAFFPTTNDARTTGNPIFDYYSGVELHPRLFGVDIKQFTNCRFGMIYWGVAPISYALKQYELYGFVSDAMLVSVIIQVVYVTKFFWWETGYFETLDIIHDRAGFMLCWGCMVWVPSVYTITTQYLVEHPHVLGQALAGTILVIGLFSVALNYLIDEQRQRFRRLNGKIKTWGKPAQFIEASYKTADGKTHTSLLLTSGWWGLCRKFNYTLELMAAFSWSVPALFSHFLPYFYFVFLFILLVDRAYRDNSRCQNKYGEKWNEYCKKVKYMLIPGIF